MRAMLLALALVFSLPLPAQERPGKPPQFRVGSLEEIFEDDSRVVVHYVTNRLLVGVDEGKPAWKSLVPDKLFLRATETPLAGHVVVKHDGSPDVENDSNLKHYAIETFKPSYKVRVFNQDDTLPFIGNEVKDDGMGFLHNLWRRDVLIYIHGFNNNWETAVRRAAQLKRDFKKLYKKDFSILVYSWPSHGGSELFGLGGLAEYRDDERRYKQSLPAIATFMEAILMKDGGTQGRGQRWGLMHSMGNRAGLHGFAEFGRRMEAAKRPMPKDLFTRVVLAAPDMEVNDFKTHTDYLFQFCAKKKPVMYFHATSNIAVNVSSGINLNDRAGVTPVLSDRLLTVDAKAAKSPLSELGHGYYASNDKMLRLTADYLFNEGDPTKSPDLEAIPGDQWRLK